MSSANSKQPASVSLEELTALNDEMAAFIRAGLPLELGLRSPQEDLPRRLRGLNERLLERLQQGMSLAEALDAEGKQLPSAYRAVVKAGLESGRLPEALESLSKTARALLALRRQIVLASLYPSLILVLAYGMFIAFLLGVIPHIQTTYALFRLETHGVLNFLTALQRSVAYWGPGIPLLLVAAVFVDRIAFLCRGGMGDSPRWPKHRSALLRGFNWLPGMKRILGNFHRATFSELLRMLLEHGVPLPKALNLAAEATGDGYLVTAAGSLADDVAAGQSLSQSLQVWCVFPPFMQWMLRTSDERGQLADGLGRLAALYRRRAEHQAGWFQIALPVLLVVVVGGGAVLLYSLALFLPLQDLFDKFADFS